MIRRICKSLLPMRWHESNLIVSRGSRSCICVCVSSNSMMLLPVATSGQDDDGPGGSHSWARPGQRDPMIFYGSQDGQFNSPLPMPWHESNLIFSPGSRSCICVCASSNSMILLPVATSGQDDDGPGGSRSWARPGQRHPIIFYDSQDRRVTIAHALA